MPRTHLRIIIVNSGAGEYRVLDKNFPNTRIFETDNEISYPRGRSSFIYFLFFCFIYWISSVVIACCSTIGTFMNHTPMLSKHREIFNIQSKSRYDFCKLIIVGTLNDNCLNSSPNNDPFWIETYTPLSEYKPTLFHTFLFSPFVELCYKSELLTYQNFPPFIRTNWYLPLE